MKDQLSNRSTHRPLAMLNIDSPKVKNKEQLKEERELKVNQKANFYPAGDVIRQQNQTGVMTPN